LSGSIVQFCSDLPKVAFAPGEDLMTEGSATGRLYVLADGTVEILKEGFRINLVSGPGAILGDMSILLDIPHMATVRAVTSCTAYVTTEGRAFLQAHPEVSYALAEMLAQRLNGVTAYLVDLKRQFEGETNHLGMVDEILETLLHKQRGRFTPGSDRDLE